MRLVLDVECRGAQFTGTLRRPADQAGVKFWGVLELVAALEQLVRPAGPEGDSGLGQPAEGQ
jgi:hypothetical protein